MATSKERVEEIMEMVHKYGTRGASEKLKIKESTVERYTRLGKSFNIQKFDFPQETHWKDFLNKAINEQDFRQDIDPDNNDLVLDIEPNFGKYFCFMPTSDWHLGSKATDYKRFESNIQFLIDNDMPTVLVGDMIDNFIKFPTMLPIFDQVLIPAQQKLMMQSLFNEIGSNIMVATWGNHEDVRDEKLLGENLTARSFLDRHIPYFKGIGEVLLKSEKTCYKMLLSHSLKGYSQYNPNHAQHKALLNKPDCDIVISGHTHSPSIQMMPKFNKDVCFIQLGTVKTKGDSFSDRYFAAKAIEREYIVMLDTEQKSFEVVGLDFFKRFVLPSKNR